MNAIKSPTKDQTYIALKSLIKYIKVLKNIKIKNST